MSEEKEYRPPGAENFKMRETPSTEKQGFLTAMTKGALKGGIEMAATIAAASATDGPVQPANLFKDENESSKFRGNSGNESGKGGASDESRGEEKQEKELSAPEKQLAKREQKTAKPGRERSQPPAREPRGDQKEQSAQYERSKLT